MTPVAISPIAQVEPVVVLSGWQVSQRHSTAALRLADLTPLSKVLIKADANGKYTALHKVGFGKAQQNSNDVLEVGCDPGGWILLGSIGAAHQLIAEVESNIAKQSEYVTVVDLTHGRALMRLSGVDAEKLLNKICAIDLSDDVTPNMSAFRSSVAKLVTDVIRNDLADGTRSYLLHCERSSGQHLFNCILDAGSEFGIDVDGFATTSS